MHDDNAVLTEQSKLPNVLRNKNYLLILLGGFVSHVGQTFYSLAVSFYILQITNNNPIIQGLYLACATAVALLLTPIGGVIADRINKAKIMYITDFIRGIAILASGFLVLIYSENIDIQLIILFCVAIILSINSALFGPAAGSITKFVVKEEQFQQASSYMSSASSLQGIIGVLAAGIFYAAFGIFWVFIFTGVAYVASAISEIFIRYNHVKPESTTNLQNVFTDMREGFSYLLTKRALLSVALIALGLNFFITPLFGNGLPYFFNTVLADRDFLFSNFMSKESWLAAIQIAISLGSLLAALVFSRKVSKKSTAKRIKTALILMSAVIILYAVSYAFFIHFTDNLNAYLIIMTALMFVLGIVMVRVNIPIGVSIMKTCDSHMIGKVSSLTSTLAQAAIPIASILAGVIISYLGLIGLMCFSVIGFVIITVYAVSNKAMNQLR